MLCDEGSQAPRPGRATPRRRARCAVGALLPRALTTNQGLQLPDNHNSLKAGVRGPTLLEDFILREKITHFDHERIPERAVHARGAARTATSRSTSPWCSTPAPTSCRTRTPHAGVRALLHRGRLARLGRHRARRARLRRQVLHREGNYDLVGNNIPVFFIQDAMKFPDLIHAVKPEPHHEMPQAASAHDTFWDFASLMPESTHMLMWADVGPRHPAQPAHDGRLRRPHLPLHQRARRATSSSSTGSPSWASTAWPGTRRRRSPARTPTSTAATCGRRSRARRLPRMGAGRADRSTRTRSRWASTCWTRPS
jgi:hypothetical protein